MLRDTCIRNLGGTPKMINSNGLFVIRVALEASALPRPRKLKPVTTTIRATTSLHRSTTTAWNSRKKCLFPNTNDWSTARAMSPVALVLLYELAHPFLPATTFRRLELNQRGLERRCAWRSSSCTTRISCHRYYSSHNHYFSTSLSSLMMEQA